MKTSLNTMRFGYIPQLKCVWWRFVHTQFDDYN